MIDVDVRGSRILVVDDTCSSRDALRHELEAAGYQVLVTDSGAAALDMAKRVEPALILLDVTMPGMDGLEVGRRLMQVGTTEPTPVVFLTVRDAVDSVVDGFRAGTVDYVVKPFRMEDVLWRVRARLERVSLRRELAARNAELVDGARQLAEERLALEEEVAQRQRVTSERDALADRLSHLSHEIERQEVDNFVGQSRAVRVVLEEIALLQEAPTVSVLITGESGTGKEGIVRAIHFGGRRAKGPFVAVNCAAIPRDLAESSFFGHARGAFTGAHDSHRGYFEQADGGTLFLDEVGDLSLELQAKLLRTLEGGLVTRLGETQARPVDVRILAATNQELTALIAQDRFREDLYFRLAGFTVAVPPLRQRREDIPLLADHFLHLFAAHMSRESPGLSPDALRVLEQHHYPGNVRELKNLIEYALIRSSGAVIRPEHLRFVEFHYGGEAEEDAQIGKQSRRAAKDEDRSLPPEERILAYLRAYGSISNTDCRNLLSVDIQRASYLLKKLHAEGVLEKHGERRWTRYSLPSGASRSRLAT